MGWDMLGIRLISAELSLALAELGNNDVLDVDINSDIVLDICHDGEPHIVVDVFLSLMLSLMLSLILFLMLSLILSWMFSVILYLMLSLILSVQFLAVLEIVLKDILVGPVVVL